MNRQIHLQVTLRLIISWLLIALLPAWQTQAQKHNVHLSKHAKKIHETLTEYSSGSFLHLFLCDHTDKFGNLKTLTDTSIEFTDVNTAATTSINYVDIDHVTPGSPSALAATGGRPRHRGSIGFLVIIGVVTVVAVAIIATTRD